MFTQLHGKEKREEGDRSGHEDKRGNQKERDRSSQQSVLLSVLHSLERFTVLGREESGQGEIEATWWRKRRVKRGESNQASDPAPKSKWVLKIGFLKVQS